MTVVLFSSRFCLYVTQTDRFYQLMNRSVYPSQAERAWEVLTPAPHQRILGSLAYCRCLPMLRMSSQSQKR